jgi:hypothetical protein
MPLLVDWERRNSCKRDLAKFALTYLPNTFYLEWAAHHKRCIAKMEAIFLEGGVFALAMPRAEGKTALARAAMLWGTLYAHRLFPFFIGSAQPKAEASLEFIKNALYGSELLRQDFPEVCYPIWKLENRWHLAKGQTYRDESTYIDWGSDGICYPICLLSREEADYFETGDEGFLIDVETEDRPDVWITRSAGIILKTSGIDGSIRGEASSHPILLTQPRPDVVLIDDVQKDSKVDSEASGTKLKLLIDGAISFLSGPQDTIAAIMPCTVIRENDVADTYTNPELRPDWQGEKHARVISWPPGIDDEKVTVDSPEGKAWTEYQRLRHLSLRERGDASMATEYYSLPENRTLMDNGFVCSWPQRYDPKKELSAQQAAMNARFKVGSAVFMAECQNRGRKPPGEGVVPIRSMQLREKTISLPEKTVPVDTRSLVVHIDIQNEILYWCALACSADFTGVFTSYGTFPEAYLPYFHKSQTEEWSMLSKMFFEAYPDQRHKATKVGQNYRAPLEAKIYHALSQCIKYILSLNFIRDDPFHTPIHIHRIGIDTRWGQVTGTVKRFVRDWSLTAGQSRPGQSTQTSGYVARDILIPYSGQGITALQKQMEEWQRTRGWLFEDELNPSVKEVKWVWRPDAMGFYQITVDVNRMKTFLFQRLASPPGSPGSICLFAGPPDRHQLFCDHVCESEYPQVIINQTTVLQKEMWTAREGGHDNDYLDCATACMALAAYNGVSIKHVETDQPRRTQKPRRLSDQWHHKRGTAPSQTD